MDGSDDEALLTLTFGELLMRALRRICLGAMVFSIGACSDLLDVSDPGSIQGEQLSDPALETLIVNGVIGEFQVAYGSYALWSGVLSDEIFTDHTNVAVREFSLHNFIDLNDTNEGVYVNLQRTRQSADDASQRLKDMLGAGASTSLNLARVYAYGAYSYVLLAEGFCEIPVNLSEPHPPAEIFRRGVARFDSAIATATAYRGTTTVAANVAAANDIINMSNLGAARASLKLGELAKARAYAALVPANYEKLVLYSSNSVRENNPVHRPARTADPFVGIHPTFQGLNDPRVPTLATARLGLNSNPIFPPQKPAQYAGWSAAAVTTIDITTNIKLATYLEAQYIIAEADGPTASTLAFVNARRAVGNQAPVSLTGTALMTELRAQRARDFFLTGQRLGDLRRYLAAGTDLFPKGKYPVFADFYGENKCFLVPLSEKAGNPSY
jgi:hypothetical protein